MERLTHPYQFAFLKGQYIHDGILALHEIINEVKVRCHKDVFLKLDFQKAYDRLEWAPPAAGHRPLYGEDLMTG
jgi:hypothetical protein